MDGRINDIVVTVEAPIKESTGPKFGNNSASPIMSNITVDRTAIRFNPNSIIIKKKEKKFSLEKLQLIFI